MSAAETTLEYLRKEDRGFSPATLKTSAGDLRLVCDALEDYAHICGVYLERERDTMTAYQAEATRCRVEKYLAIAKKYAAAIGYDREKALERCRKRREDTGGQDTGEEALAALVRYGTENGKKNGRKV